MNKIHLHIILVAILLIGAINWGLVGLFKFNLVEFITFNNDTLKNLIYIVVGLTAVYLMFQRDFYLPFLGQAVMPHTLIKDVNVDQFNKEIKLCDIPADVIKVIYWAAEPATDSTINDYKKAYNKYTNIGTTEVVNNCATIRLKMPQQYTVHKYIFFGTKLLPSHFHYRYVYTNGMTSRIMTHNL